MTVLWELELHPYSQMHAAVAVFAVLLLLLCARRAVC